MDIFLWNQSPENLDDPTGQLIADACDRQMQEDVAPAYGLQPSPRVSYVPYAIEREDLPLNCLVIIFADDLERAEAAVRVEGRMYGGSSTLDRDNGGRNFARVYPKTILDGKGTPLTGAHSISAATSHECIEATYDRNVALWVWNWNDQMVVAAEVCDPVEEDAYTKRVQEQDVAVSNFVYPAWFDAGAPVGSRFDQMQRLHAPFSHSDGGYLIVYNPAKPEDGVHPEPEPRDDALWGWNAKVKKQGFARTRVRLVWKADRLVWKNL